MKNIGERPNSQCHRMVALAISAICLFLVTLAHAQSTLSLTGGGGSSSGEDYKITGTIGQMDGTSVMAGEDIELTGRVTTMLGTLPTSDGTTLTIAVTPQNMIVISWPSDGTDFVLEQSSDLGSPTWATIGATPEDDGWTKTVTMPVTMGNKFFRLRKP